MITHSILKKSLLLALIFLAPAAAIYELVSVSAAIIFILSFVLHITIAGNAVRPKVSLALALVFGGLLTAAVASGTHFVWLPLLVALAGAVSIATNRISGGLFSLAPAYVAIAGFAVHTADLWLIPVFSLLGYGYAVLVQRLIKLSLTPNPMPPNAALTYGMLLTVAGGIATWLCIQLQVPHSYWLVLSTVMVMRPQRSATLKVMGERSLATILGAIVAVLVLHFVATPLIIVLIIALTLLFFCYILLDNYFAQITLLTTTLLLLLSVEDSSSGDDTAFIRVGLTLAGVAFAAIMYSLSLVIVRRDTT